MQSNVLLLNLNEKKTNQVDLRVSNRPTREGYVGKIGDFKFESISKLSAFNSETEKIHSNLAFIANELINLLHISNWTLPVSELKFIYSEKAIKFCEIFPLLLTAVHTDFAKFCGLLRIYELEREHHVTNSKKCVAQKIANHSNRSQAFWPSSRNRIRDNGTAYSF